MSDRPAEPVSDLSFPAIVAHVAARTRGVAAPADAVADPMWVIQLRHFEVVATMGELGEAPTHRARVAVLGALAKQALALQRAAEGLGLVPPEAAAVDRAFLTGSQN